MLLRGTRTLAVVERKTTPWCCRRYSYIRLALVIKYSFYKNLTFTILPVWSGLQSGFTGQTLHDAVVLMGYNMVYVACLCGYSGDIVVA